jgi:hypothetical protein
VRLQDYRDTFYEFSGKASDLSRQLAFAAIALIWLFKKDVGGQPTLPRELILPGILVVASLTLEMLQYCVASIIWRTFYRRKEEAGVGENVEIEHSEWLERPITLLFAAKIVCVVAAYIAIFIFLIKTLLG